MRAANLRFRSVLVAACAALLVTYLPAAAAVKPRPPSTVARPPAPDASAPPPIQRGPKPRGWLSPQAVSGTDLLYVANNSEVLIFPQHGHSGNPIGVITDGVFSAYGLYVDRARTLYVCNWRDDTVAAYPSGSASPSIVYTHGVFGPLYATVDASGNVYISNGGAGTVVEFPPGQSQPSRTLVTPGTEADGLDVDAAGNLYVAYRHAHGDVGGIMFFPSGSSQGTNLGVVLHQPQGLTIDPSGNILVAETGRLHRVVVFAPGQVTPSKRYEVPGIPTEVAFGRGSVRLYVSDLKDDVDQLRYPHGTVRIKLAGSVFKGVQGLAVSPAEKQ